MLEGQEISIINKSKARSKTGEFRIDSDYYKKQYLLNERILHKLDTEQFFKYCDFIKKGIFDLPPSNYVSEGIPLIRTSEIKCPTINFNTTVFISKSINRANHKTILTPYDLVFTKIGAYIGDVAILPKTYNEYNFSQNVAGIKLKKSEDGPFLLSFFLSKIGRNQIQRSIMLSGQGKLELDDIRHYEIPKVSDTLKKEFVILFNLIEKITAKSNESYSLAESILYESVGMNDYELSDYNINIKNIKDSYYANQRLDAEHYLPKYDDLEKLIKKQNFAVLRDLRTDNFRGLQPVYFEDGDLDVINSKHILEMFLDYDNFEKTRNEYWVLQEKARVFKGDILTYTTGANIGRTQVYLKDKRAIASNHVNIIRLKSGNPIYIAFVLNSKLGRLQTEKRSAGSAQAELYPKDLDDFYIPLIEPQKQNRISDLVEDSLRLKTTSERLLDVAKRAVEIVIEKDEKTAITLINENKT